MGGHRDSSQFFFVLKDERSPPILSCFQSGNISGNIFPRRVNCNHFRTHKRMNCQIGLSNGKGRSAMMDEEWVRFQSGLTRSHPHDHTTSLPHQHTTSDRPNLPSYPLALFPSYQLALALLPSCPSPPLALALLPLPSCPCPFLIHALPVEWPKTKGNDVGRQSRG